MQSLTPDHATDEPPPWLDPDQAESVQLLLHALRTYGAVLCAEPVGSGKTYLALAVARALTIEPATCLVPASLAAQWRATAERVGMSIEVWSHSRLSRGQLPRGAPSLVIVDESHHFRHPGIRRYRTLAPWLIGRRVLLLSATPVVNGSSDLYHLLHLGLRDDALAAEGAPSLRTAFGRGTLPAALGKFVIQRLEAAHAPSSGHVDDVVDSGAVVLLPRIDALALSTHPEIAALVRCVILRAAASSTAALLSVLRRYRHLLMHAQDARAAGRPLDRKHLRGMIAASSYQLLFWSLLPSALESGELLVDDLPLLEGLIEVAAGIAEQPDEKSARLASLLGDGVPTLVFVTARETIPYLRRILPDRWLAWCTGDRAGIGGTCMPREDVLAWFRPNGALVRPGVRGQPITLLTTDVAAEGLDLQTAGRVIHYDLPWTDVRLTQRNGRAVRRGSQWSHVAIVRFLPGPGFESRLPQQDALTRKARLPERHGLGPAGRGFWRWRHDLKDSLAGPATEGVCVVRSDRSGVLAGIALVRGDARVASTIFWRDDSCGWTEDPAMIEPRLLEAARAPQAPILVGMEVGRALASLAPVLKVLLREASAPRIAGLPPTAGALRLGKRLRALASHAARYREAALLEVLGRALHFASRGHTAGEAMRINELTLLDDDALLRALPGLPPPPPPEAPIRLRLTGLILFEGPGGDGTCQPEAGR